MKAVTLGQPHASLVALGAQTVLTTEHPTGHRGPLVIHAAKRQPSPWNVSMGEWSCAVFGDGTPYAIERSGVPVALPLGAVVATARLVDVVPIVDYDDVTKAIARDEPLPRPHIVDTTGIGGERYPNLGSLRQITDTDDERGRTSTIIDLQDQLPYGDFTPGRFAWILDDVKATTDRCPACMANCVRTAPHATALRCFCPTCDGNGTCPPVPAKGRSGLWTWTP